jgi:hypothetical protein
MQEIKFCFKMLSSFTRKQTTDKIIPSCKHVSIRPLFTLLAVVAAV